ncbi:MAG: DUF2339 domain-containing protein [Ruminococcus sp.]|nr:DUF2339 domain-containing protein [Ruminococcus sp.]
MDSTEERLRALEMRVTVLQRQVLELQKQQIPQNQNAQAPPANPVTSPVNIQKQQINNNPAPNIIPQNSNISPNNNIPTQIPSKENVSFERRFGREAMGIIASVFVFIGLLLLYAFLPRFMRIIGIYVIGLLMIAVGFIGKKHSKYKIFFDCFAGCGAGVIYISLFLTYSYYAIANYFSLYIGIFIWAIIILFMSKKIFPIFRIIGQTGITISILFYIANLNFYFLKSPDEWQKIFFTIIYFFIVCIVYQLADSRKGLKSNLLTIIFFTVDIILIAIPFKTSNSIISDTKIWSVLTGSVLILFILFQYFWYIWKVEWSERQYPAMFCGVSIWTLFFIKITSNNLLYPLGGDIKNLIIIAMAVVLWCICQWHCESKIVKNIILTVFLIMLLPAIHRLSDYYELCLWIVLTATIAINGLYFLEKYYVQTAYVFLIYGLIFTVPSMSILNEMLKSSYMFLLIYAIIALINTFTTLYCRHKHLQKGLQNIAYGITILQMLSGFVLILTIRYDFIPLVILADMLVISVFLLNSIFIFKQSNKYPLILIYLCIKFTILILFILPSFYANRYVYSIACIIFGIILLVFGFMKSKKYVRIYGLSLFMLFVCKLLLLDISYNNLKLHALGFLACGIICFGISYLYSRMDKFFELEKEKN